MKKTNNYNWGIKLLKQQINICLINFSIYQASSAPKVNILCLFLCSFRFIFIALAAISFDRSNWFFWWMKWSWFRLYIIFFWILID